MTAAISSRAMAIAAMRQAERGLVEIADREPESAEAAARLALHEAALHEAWSAAAGAYLAQLPRRAISRCPFTGAVFDIPIDDAGLDGPWWCYDAPLRTAFSAPPTFLGLSGAMRLHEPVERAPHLAVPGPGVPWLLPRLLADPAVVAVISTVPVGAHTGIAIAYFAAQPPSLDPPDTWGANMATAPGGGWSQADDDEEAYDYDLARWLAAGRVRWIAPGDASLQLRDGLPGCPYVDMDGPRHVQRVQDGEVW